MGNCHSSTDATASSTKKRKGDSKKLKSRDDVGERHEDYSSSYEEVPTATLPKDEEGGGDDDDDERHEDHVDIIAPLSTNPLDSASPRILGNRSPFEHSGVRTNLKASASSVGSSWNLSVMSAGTDIEHMMDRSANLPTYNLSALSVISPRPTESEVEALKTNYAGGFYHTGYNLQMLTPEERRVVRREELHRFQNPGDEELASVVAGKGILLFHPHHDNAPLPLATFRKEPFRPEFLARQAEFCQGAIEAISVIQEQLSEGHFDEALAIIETVYCGALRMGYHLASSLFIYLEVCLRDYLVATLHWDMYRKALKNCDVENILDEYEQTKPQHSNSGSEHMKDYVRSSIWEHVQYTCVTIHVEMGAALRRMQ